MSEPRYIVRELIGFGSSNSTRWSRETTHVYVLDSWYGFAVVASYPPKHGVHTEARRERATVFAHRYNAEHDAWLAAA